MRIEACNLVAGYGTRIVLHNISLRLKAGEFVGLIGPNGAGKSTLLRTLVHTPPPRQGTVWLDGKRIQHFSAREIARRIAFVPQTEPTLFEFTVREVVLMGRHPHVRGMFGETSEDFTLATRAMAAADILHLADRPVTALSGGEHRRVLIARALAQNAPTLLLDEPTAHLDLMHQTDLLRVVRRQVDREGAAVLAALHDLNMAAEFCDRLILLSSGRIAAEGAPGTVLTAETLLHVYGVPVQVVRNPTSGQPLVLPTYPAPDSEAQPAHRVHVICGGGTGLTVLSGLLRRGYRVTAGVLNRLDSDEDAAAALGIEHVTEAPFSPIGPEARAACAPLIARAEAIVITDVPFGNGNLPNLEMALEAQAAGKAIFLFGGTPISARDFAGGAAVQLWNRLLEGGAHPVADLDALEAALRAGLRSQERPHESAGGR